MATLEKSGVVGILCTLGDTILPPEVPAIACVACTTEFWTIEAVGGTWADTTVDVDAALVDVVTDGGGRSASWTAFWTARERALDSAVTFTCIVLSWGLEVLFDKLLDVLAVLVARLVTVEAEGPERLGRLLRGGILVKKREC